jgi:hypothetical protein
MRNYNATLTPLSMGTFLVSVNQKAMGNTQKIIDRTGDGRPSSMDFQVHPGSSPISLVSEMGCHIYTSVSHTELCSADLSWG